MYKIAVLTEDERKMDQSQPVAARKREPIRKLSAISPANEEAALAILPPFLIEKQRAVQGRNPEKLRTGSYPPPPPPATVELASQREGTGGDSSIPGQLATDLSPVQRQNATRSYRDVCLGLDNQRISNTGMRLQSFPANTELQRRQSHQQGAILARMESLHAGSHQERRQKHTQAGASEFRPRLWLSKDHAKSVKV